MFIEAQISTTNSVLETLVVWRRRNLRSLGRMPSGAPEPAIESTSKEPRR